jgi:predicted transcriptional regulator
MSDQELNNQISTLTGQIVAAYMSVNKVPTSSIPDLIGTVYRALADNASRGTAGATPDPAVPIDKSVTPDYVICLEDGKKLKMLKRHLMNAFKMTPAEYRERWRLPPDYPMVAPNYAKRRSAIAKEFGLGTRKSRRRRPAGKV